ncbi:tripartite tricarboxylate transporter substrate binding protein [Pigmentiphaga soli]|uniref:Tripartite tricarboxylate transporter substrate binding protein n=1 Tax=Pigmentiphaga soli TaxID=1007095 RepID=A0ABP8H6T5_9BURK
MRDDSLHDAARRRYLGAGLGLPLASALAPSLARAAEPLDRYPSRPVTLVVPFAPGGTSDVVGRVVGQMLTESLSQSFVAENRAGAAGIVGWNTVARADPDGYTLLVTDMSLAIAPGLQPNLPFDPARAFKQVVTISTVPHVLVVNPKLPVNTVQEFIALAKARPGKLFYGSGGIGTNTHLRSELFKSVTGTDIVHVAYKGGGAVLPDLMAGQVQSMVSSAPTVLPYIRSGKIKPLMVTSSTRMSVLPDVPSAVEAGLPKMVMLYWSGLAAPAGVPDPLIHRINGNVVKVLRQPAAQKRFTEMGLDIRADTPEEATQLVNDEIARWTDVVKTAHIKAD